jgi:proteasome lid subunit RPN8/RPN11
LGVEVVMGSFSNTDLIVLPKATCWPIVFAAIEVFPKECMGGVALASRRGKVAMADFAFPYQLAMRKMDEVASNSGAFFDGVMRRKLADFHSHPHVGREPVLSFPSEMDLDGMYDGDVEIIISVGRKKSKASRSMGCRRGIVSGAIGRFRFSMKAFVRLGENDAEEIEYRQVMLAIL